MKTRNLLFWDLVTLFIYTWSPVHCKLDILHYNPFFACCIIYSIADLYPAILNRIVLTERLIVPILKW